MVFQPRLDDFLMSLDSCAARLTNDPDLSFFAFFPTIQGGRIGGTIFSLVCKNDGVGKFAPVLLTKKGYFSPPSSEDDCIPLSALDAEIPKVVESYGVDPRHLMYKPCTAEQASAAWRQPPTLALATLNGYSYTDSQSLPSREETNRWLEQHLQNKHGGVSSRL